MIRGRLLFFLLVILSFGIDAQSQFFADSIFSKNLNEYRKLTVYLPAEYNETSTVYPVIYTTDGQSITEVYRKNSDSLIANKLVKPFILIGSHSNEKPAGGGLQYRNMEYMRVKYNPERPLTILFEQHMRFFTEELIQYAESNYRVSKDPKERTFYGTSNGADFGLALAQDHPELLKNFILFSVFNGIVKPLDWNKKDGVYLYLGYGLKEPEHVSEAVIEIDNYCNLNTVTHSVVSWLGGHKQKEWEITFVKALIGIMNQNADKK